MSETLDLEKEQASEQPVVTRQIVERNLLAAIRDDRSKETGRLLSELDAMIQNDKGYGLDLEKSRRFPSGDVCQLLDMLAYKAAAAGSTNAFRTILGFGATVDEVKKMLPEKKHGWVDKVLSRQSLEN